MDICYFHYFLRPHFGHHQVYVIFIFCTVLLQFSLQRVKSGVALFISRNILNQDVRRDVFIWGFNVPTMMQTFFDRLSMCPIFSSFLKEMWICRHYEKVQ